MDVGLGLRNLGLGQYETAFRDNEIDGRILPTLTAEDLKNNRAENSDQPTRRRERKMQRLKSTGSVAMQSPEPERFQLS
jgi:transposase-like protein